MACGYNRAPRSNTHDPSLHRIRRSDRALSPFLDVADDGDDGDSEDHDDGDDADDGSGAAPGRSGGGGGGGGAVPGQAGAELIGGAVVPDYALPRAHHGLVTGLLDGRFGAKDRAVTVCYLSTCTSHQHLFKTRKWREEQSQPGQRQRTKTEYECVCLHLVLVAVLAYDLARLLAAAAIGITVGPRRGRP